MNQRQAIRLLRRALGANALFSSVAAAILLAGATRLASHFTLSSRDLAGLGLQLGVFAGLLILLASRPGLGRRWTLIAAALVALADLGWAAASLVALAVGLAWTGTGWLLALLGAAGTSALGLLQARAVASLWRAPLDGSSLPRRTWGARLRRAAILAAGIVALFAVLYALLPWADLRSAALRHPRAGTESGEAARRGRELLEAVARAHGIGALRGHRTMEIVAVDEWAGASPWWPAPTQRFRARRLIGTFTSQVELLDGPGSGEIRGLQSWRPYRRASLAAPLETPDRDPMVTFYLPTLQYFDELPLRLLEATVALDAGEAEHDGRTWRRLFVTWDGAAPHRGADQYDLWLDPESLRIGKVAYTVRDGFELSPAWTRPLMRFAALGTMHYDDYRDVDGVLLPFLQTVTLGTVEQTPVPLEEGFLHRLRVESVRFDSVAPGELQPIAGLPEPADRKG